MLRNLLSIEELAEKLKVKKSWIYAQTKESGKGSFPKIKIGKYLRFDETAVSDWIKKQNTRESE